MDTLTTPAVLNPPEQWGVGEVVAGDVFAGCSDDELLEIVAADERLAAWITSHGVAAVGELARRAEEQALVELSPGAPARARNLALVGARESIVDEVALASGLGQRAVVTRVEVARGNPDRFRAVRTALAAGQMSWPRVVQFTDRTADVDSQRVQSIAAKVLEPWSILPDGQADAGGLAVPQSEFSRRLSRGVAAARTTAEQHRDAVARRDARVVLNPAGDGAFTVSGDAARVAAAASRVDKIARRLRKEGDSRTLAQLRSDVALDLLQHGQLSAADAAAITAAAATGGDMDGARSGGALGDDPAFCDAESSGVSDSAAASASRGALDADADAVRAASGDAAERDLAEVLAPYATFGGQLPPARVDVSVSAATLLGLSREPGTILCGSVEQWLSADQVRRIAYQAGSTWRRIVTDPATGYMADYSTTRYAVTGQLRERVFARDRYSRVPGSTRPAVFCDTDHDTDYAAGGPSSEANLSAKNRRGHNHKTHRRWKSEREPGVHGAITWTTPAGRTYTTQPHDYRDSSVDAWSLIRESVRSRSVPEVDPDDPCQSCHSRLGCDGDKHCPALTTTDATDATGQGADLRVNRILATIAGGRTGSVDTSTSTSTSTAAGAGIDAERDSDAGLSALATCEGDADRSVDESPAIVTRRPRRARYAGMWNPDDDLTPPTPATTTTPDADDRSSSGWSRRDPGPPPF